MATWGKLFAYMALAALATFSLNAVPSSKARAQTYDEAQIAEVVQSLSPFPPDIKMPASSELYAMGMQLRGISDPKGSFFRLNAIADLIELSEATFGPEHPFTGRLLIAQANELISAQALNEADATLDRAEAIISRRLDSDDSAFVTLRSARIDVLSLRGQHLKQSAAVDELENWVNQHQPDDEKIALVVANARSGALYFLGSFAGAATLGARVLDDTARIYGDESAQFASALASQVQNLVAAGRLAEAEALLTSRSPMAALDPEKDRIAIAVLHRAKARVLESKLDYAGAKDAYSLAYDGLSAAEYRLAGARINPDYETFGAVRTALDMRRLYYDQHHVLGLSAPGWPTQVWLKVEIEGTEHLSWRIDLDEPFTITNRIEAMVARNNAMHNERSSRDLDLAEKFWRELLRFTREGTGAQSVASAEVKINLADNMLKNFRPFAAQEEAEAARAIIVPELGENHPLALRAQSIAAIALVRQGRRDLARSAIDTVLEATWNAGEPLKDVFARILVERDSLLRLDRDERARHQFWEKWGPRAQTLQLYTAFEQYEQVAEALLYQAQASTNLGMCPTAAEKAQIRAAAQSLRITPPGGGEPYIPSLLLRTAQISDQIIAETIACGGAEPGQLYAFLKDQLNNRADFASNESGQAMVSRYDRWARLLVRDPAFGVDKDHTDLAYIFLSRAQSMAERQIKNARDGAGGNTADARQRRVLASEGVGLDFRYALETRLLANWRFAQAQQGKSGDDPDYLFNLNVLGRDGFDEAFEAAQLLRIDGNSQALALASARAAAPNPDLRVLVSEYQSLSAELFRLLGAGSSADSNVDAVQQRHAQLAQQIENEFPAYYDFAAPAPLTHNEVEAALSEGEGLLTILTVGEDVYVFAAQHNPIGERAWHRIEGGAEEVEILVEFLRCDLDPVECGLNAAVQTRGGGGGEAVEEWVGYAFNRNAAFDLYNMLIAPVAHVFEPGRFNDRVETLYVVTSGAISALPLSVLLTEKPQDDGFDSSGNVFRDAPWLSNRFDLAYLPSVPDLAGTARRDFQASGFVGYGDPVLAPPSDEAEPGKRGASLFVETRGGGTMADRDALMSMKSLKGAAAELSAVGALFTESGRLVTRDRATEANVKRDPDLAGAQIILFSTHGVLPDPRVGFAEAGLVFTPPDESSPDDDGLLSASEAAALDFTSELVILSACNTATQGTFSGADSLSGLARSFIFAGARSVYATHWQVNDTITKELILAAIDIGLRRPDLSRSEALSLAMDAIRTGRHVDGRPIKGWTPDWAHPSAWAPFVTITSVAREPGK